MNPEEDELSGSLSTPLQVIKRIALAHPLSERSALSQNPLMHAKRFRFALSAQAWTNPPI